MARPLESDAEGQGRGAALGLDASLIEFRGVDVRFAVAGGEVHAVRGLDLTVRPGEAVAVVGESGSGKSQAMMAALGLLAKNGRAAGSVRFKGEEILGLPRRQLDKVRGDRVSIIFQEPMTSLDPLYPVGRQIAEPMIHHGRYRAEAARARTIELLGLVGIPPGRRTAYPHELSGGERQRVMIAMALANAPDLLIADEPTTALDVTVQAQILALLADLRRRFGMAILFITHDLNLVRRIADRVYVMRGGEVVEAGEAERLLAAPEHPYTRALLAAEPEGRKAPPAAGAPVVLEARDLHLTFGLRRGLLSHGLAVTALDGVDVTLHAGETLGVVGESGSGKSTLGRVLLGLIPSDGTVRFEGRILASLDRPALRALRREMQLVFQDPFGSLSPRMTVGEIVTEGLLVHEPGLPAAERDRRAIAALEDVRLDPATRRRYPHEFSGGQRQRIAIARAMILKPKLVVLDEPTSALDRTVQKEIVDLLRRLQREHGLSYVFISHDLAVVRAMADTILVMRRGKMVEAGPAEAVFAAPREPYTRELITAAFLPSAPVAQRGDQNRRQTDSSA